MNAMEINNQHPEPSEYQGEAVHQQTRERVVFADQNHSL
jgi:hypothetical protein